MRRYHLAYKARRDLDRIFQFVASQSSPETADRIVDEIGNRFLFLAKNPEAGREREDIDSQSRSFPVGKYVIYYRRVKNSVEISRILHGARDQRKAFRGE